MALVGIAITILWPDKRWIGWVCFGLASILVIGWLSFELKRWLGDTWASLGLAITIGAIIGGAVSVAIWYGAPSPEAKAEPFSAEVRSALVYSESAPLTNYMAGYPTMFGNTASPIFYLAYIRITNTQDVNSTISDLKIAVSQEREGPWEDLPAMPLSAMTVYYLGISTPIPKNINMPHGTMRLATALTIDDMRRVAIIGVSPVLGSEFVKPIGPHLSVEGWVALDSLRHQGMPPGQGFYFRITMRDSTNKEARYVVPLPMNRGVSDPNMNENNGSFYVTGVRTDISAFHVKYYSEPFPPLSSVSKTPDNPAIARLIEFVNSAAAIQTQFIQTNNATQLAKDYEKWRAGVAAYLKGEAQINKTWLKQFNGAETEKIALPDGYDPRGTAVWVELHARQLVLSRIQTELRNKSK